MPCRTLWQCLIIYKALPPLIHSTIYSYFIESLKHGSFSFFISAIFQYPLLEYHLNDFLKKVWCWTMANQATFSTAAVSRISGFWQLSLWLTLLICNQLKLSAASQSSLGVHIVRSPESAVAPKGDEVVFECELNLTPDRLEWRFRHTSVRATDATNYKYLRGGEVGIYDMSFRLQLYVFLDILLL